MKISTILDHIDLGHIALPEFQRGYVWNREQVRDLMNSLYRGNPIGSLLIWVTQSEGAVKRGDGPVAQGVVKLLLDGQQRITTLYGIARGHAPKFFDGNVKNITGLYFNLDEEIFEFYMPAKMKDDPKWINVTVIMQKGAAEVFGQLTKKIDMQQTMGRYLESLNCIERIKERVLYIEEITEQQKTIDDVVGIFNTVNSGGTKLSKGDLALAKICASWPEAREEMKNRLIKWAKAGFNFKLEWLLRNINAILTDESLFSALEDIDINTFQKGLNMAENCIDKILNDISARLGLDHDRVLGGRGAIPLMSYYLSKQDKYRIDHIKRDKLLFWYVHTFLWGRYAGSTETVLKQDLSFIKDKDNSLDRLIDSLRQNRGDLTINEQDVTGWNKGARFYPLLYLLTRVYGAKDWCSGNELSANMLGKLNVLQVHHIFPKALLYKYKYKKSDVNAIANYTFQTQDCNLWIGKREPKEYFKEIERNHPGALETHWIPMEHNLWKPENYLDFLKERRRLIAKAANDFLNGLLHGKLPELKVEGNIMDRIMETIPGQIVSDEEEKQIVEFNEWVKKQGLPEGEMQYELCDEKTGMPLAIIDLAWPDGLQPELSKPIALLIEEEKEIKSILNKKGYLYFTSVNDLKDYIHEEYLVTKKKQEEFHF